MKRTSGIVVFIALFLILASTAGPVPAKREVMVKERMGQVTQTFINNTGGMVSGLCVTLSAEAIVVTDDDRRAGPFGNIAGNESKKITLTNPTALIADSESLELTFRSYKATLKLKSWWFLNEEGKRIGDKIKG